MWATALDIARLFHYQNAGSVEFLADEAGDFHFTELKGRIQIEHAVSEMVSDMDIVREQIRIAAGKSLGKTQEDIRPERLGDAVPDQRRRPMERLPA